MDELKKILLDHGHIFTIISSMSVIVVTALRFIVMRTLKYYDREIEKNASEHLSLLAVIHSMDIRITKLEDRINLQGGVKHDNIIIP